MTTLKRLLEDSDSPLINVDMKEALRPDIFDKLPINAIETLYDLLPLADLVFVRASPDHGPEDKLEIIKPESIEHVNQLKQDPWCALYISSGVFNNPDFKTAWEDFIVLLGEGYYEPEDEEDEDMEGGKQSVTEVENGKESIKEVGKGRRKRKTSDAIVEEDENAFKDDQYERYWGERLEKQQKKRKGRVPKSKKAVQEQEPINTDEISMEREEQTILDAITKAPPTKRGRGRTPKSKTSVQGQELQVGDELSIEGDSKVISNVTKKKSEPAKRGRGRPKKQE